MRALLLPLLLLTSSPAWPQNAIPSLPVVINPKLHAPTPADAAKRLSEPFAEGTGHPPGAGTCAALLATPLDADDGPAPDVHARKNTRAECLITRELSHATAARTTFLTDLKFDASALEWLPAELAINVSNDAIKSARGKTWATLDSSATLSAPTPDQFVISGKGFTETLIIWGRGDFNHDGRQDLLVQTIDTLTEGTYRNTRVFVLTRKSPSAKLTIVKELL